MTGVLRLKGLTKIDDVKLTGGAFVRWTVSHLEIFSHRVSAGSPAPLPLLKKSCEYWVNEVSDTPQSIIQLLEVDYILLKTLLYKNTMV